MQPWLQHNIRIYKRQGKTMTFRRKKYLNLTCSLHVGFSTGLLINPENRGETLDSLQTTRRHIPEHVETPNTTAVQLLYC